MKKIILTLLLLILTGHAWANVPNATPLFNQYNCNSSTTQFPYTFQITATSDMTVYTTDSNGNITTQSGTFSVDTTNLWVNYPLIGSACPTGSTITLIPSTPQTQTTTYGNRTPFTATAVGASFDKLTLIAQQLQGQVNRSFQQPVNFTGTAVFPTSSPGSLIGWNSSGVLANINNPAAVAQWSLSGANISYNTGNVSTTNNFSAGTLNSTGNVGIGSVNPTQLLDIEGSSSVNAQLKSSGASTSFVIDAPGANTASLALRSTGSDQVIFQREASTNDFVIFTANTEHMRMTATNGNLGIGTSSNITAKLLVNGGANIINGNVGIGSVNPGQKLDVQGTVRASFFVGSNPQINVSEQEVATTQGGAATVGSWQTRVLNTKSTDTASLCSLATNQLTCPAGTYKIWCSIPFYLNVGNTSTRLQNITASSTLLPGTSMTNAANVTSHSFISGVYTLAISSAIAVQYQTTTNNGASDLGYAGGFGTEVYTQCELTKLN